MRLDEQFIKQALPDAVLLNGKVPKLFSAVVDSRVAKQTDIFVAIKGARVDGHDYLMDAIKNGVAGIMIAHHKQDELQKIDPVYYKHLCVIAVDNPEKSLIALAAAWRRQFHYPVVAITGSVGKTSTKEMLAAILKKSGKQFIVSQGNQNTQIGVAINILRMQGEHEVAVFEAGISKRGEMREIARILKPTVAAITTIGHSHMAGLGSLQDISLEKRDLFYFFTHDQIGVINGDVPLLSSVSYAHPVIKFGSKTTNQIQARKVHIEESQIHFILKMYKDRYPITFNHPHLGMVQNALAAAALAQLLNIDREAIVAGIQEPMRVKGRFEKRALRGAQGLLINDCYNANPESMKAALLAFGQVETSAQKIAVIGDMLELGVNGPFWHRQLGRFLRKVPSLKRVILVGDMVQWTRKTIPVGVAVDWVPSWQEAIKVLEPVLDTQESMVLVKGSRAMGLDRVVDAFSE